MDSFAALPFSPSRSFSYTEYRYLLDTLMDEGKTTGPNQEPDILEYARLNIHRMRRLDKTVKLDSALTAALHSLTQPYSWLLITEGWCGDAAQIVPVLAQIAEVSPHIHLQLILRDENLPIMDRYLTNGGRAIPVLVCFNAAGDELWHWGPRPAEAQKIVTELRKEFPDSWKAQAEKLHKWYTDDKTAEIQKEILQKIKLMK